MIIVYSKATTVINCTLLSLADFIQKVFLHSDTFEGMSLSQLVLTMLDIRIGSPDFLCHGLLGARLQAGILAVLLVFGIEFHGGNLCALIFRTAVTKEGQYTVAVLPVLLEFDSVPLSFREHPVPGHESSETFQCELQDSVDFKAELIQKHMILLVRRHRMVISDDDQSSVETLGLVPIVLRNVVEGEEKSCMRNE